MIFSYIIIGWFAEVAVDGIGVSGLELEFS